MSSQAILRRHGLALISDFPQTPDVSMRQHHTSSMWIRILELVEDDLEPDGLGRAAARGSRLLHHRETPTSLSLFVFVGHDRLATDDE